MDKGADEGGDVCAYYLVHAHVEAQGVHGTYPSGHRPPVPKEVQHISDLISHLPFLRFFFTTTCTLSKNFEMALGGVSEICNIRFSMNFGDILLPSSKNLKSGL